MSNKSVFGDSPQRREMVRQSEQQKARQLAKVEIRTLTRDEYLEEMQAEMLGTLRTEPPKLHEVLKAARERSKRQMLQRLKRQRLKIPKRLWRDK